MKNFWGLFCISLLASNMVYGQNDAQSKMFEDFKKQHLEQFNQFKSTQQAEYDKFRRAQNEQYAEFIKNSWATLNALPAIMPQEEEKDVTPVIYEESIIDTTNTTSVFDEAIPTKKEVIVVPQPQPQPEPIAPVQPKANISYKTVSIAFYGSLVSVGFPTSDNLKLKGLTEKSISEAWLQLSDEAYDITLSNVLNIRKNLALCDWGYIEMLQAISEKQYGKTNEAVLMQAFLLAQSNYKTRLAYDDSKLYILIASQYSILRMSRYEIDGEYFYPLNCNAEQLRVCKAFFENEKAISLQLREEQKFDYDPTQPRKLSSTFGVVANIDVNQNELDFFAKYPSAYINNNSVTRWAVYANTPMSRNVKEKLYPTIRASIKGLSEKDAVNKILNFVQTAFTYGYDNQVWGCDRAFFASETLHYPYSDCEDRSILFARLVRDIVGLEVVLLYYPGHLATAVGFKQEVEGDYLLYKNRRFTVCDPTFINAPVGKTMPGMNNKEAQVIALQ